MTNEKPRRPEGGNGGTEKRRDGPEQRSLLLSWLVLVVILAGAAWWRWSQLHGDEQNVDYSAVYAWAEKGTIERATFKGRTVIGHLRAPALVSGHQLTDFQSQLPEPNEPLLPLLRKTSSQIVVQAEVRPFLAELALAVLPWLALLGGLTWMARQQGALGHTGPLRDITKSTSHRFDAERSPGATFEDIAGLESAKRDLQEIVRFLKEPERFRRLGAKVPRGVLLVGPPGTGKTLLARAVAGESKVPFFSVNASEFVEMFVGLGAARVRDMFEEAKKNQPAILFIDEIDAVGRARGAGMGLANDEREQTLNQLLAEMDGFSREALLVVLAATNRPDVLDPALLRPGRFDRHVLVDRPELAARRAILGVHLKGKPLAPDVDPQAIAEGSAGFSGADLANLVNEAAINAIRRGAERIAAEDFAAANDKIALGDPREGKLGPKEKRRVAVHEAGHAVLARFTEQAEPPRRVSILPRGLTLGATQQTATEDRHLVTYAELRAKLAVIMGGYAAEKLLLAEVSTGVEHDLKQAADIATAMVARYGMSERLGPAYFDPQAEHPFLGRRLAVEGGISEGTLHEMEAESRRLMTAAGSMAAETLARHRTALDRLVEALLRRETIEQPDLEAVLSGAAPKLQPIESAA